jgi:taurine dioxygenase
MASLKVRPLRDDLPFGSRVSGVTWDSLKDEGVRKQMADLFEERGVLVLDDCDPTSKFQVEVSKVFGPLKDHPVKNVPRVNNDTMPGVIVIENDPHRVSTMEVDGQRRICWQPYHFDHSYNNELNRGGVLRSVVTPPEGGLTSFADGIQLYNALSPDLRNRIDGKNIIYTLDLQFEHMRFGIPKNVKLVERAPDNTTYEISKTLPRSIHPAIWKRSDGQKVLHACGYGARGIEGHEGDPEYDKLLDDVLQEILVKVQPYIHQWKPTDLVVWDNWRVLHEALGVDPKYDRCVHRTTIKGDYGLGYWENHVAGPGGAPKEMM